MITIEGKKYIFNIGSDINGDDTSCFFIRAIHKSNRKSSCINNLNAILSLLDVNIDDPKYNDSMWEVNKKEAKKFYNTAVEAISDTHFAQHLEKKLDEDREAGEWENTS